MNVQWNFRERVTRNSHCLLVHLLRPSAHELRPSVHACHMLCHRSTRVTATRISISSVCCLQYKILNQVEGVLYMYMYSCVKFHTTKVTMNNHIFLKRRQALDVTQSRPCARCVSANTDLICCNDGVTWRWGLLSHAQNAVWLAFTCNFHISIAITSMPCLCTTNSNTVTLKQ